MPEHERGGPKVTGPLHWLCGAALAGWCTLLAAASLMPVAPDAAIGSTAARRLINNMLHVPAYCVLAGLWIVFLRGGAARRSGSAVRAPLAGAGLAAGYGGALEVLQIWVPGRFGGWADVGLNCLGAGLAGLILWRRYAGGGRALERKD